MAATFCLHTYYRNINNILLIFGWIYDVDVELFDQNVCVRTCVCVELFRKISTFSPTSSVDENGWDQNVE